MVLSCNNPAPTTHTHTHTGVVHREEHAAGRDWRHVPERGGDRCAGLRLRRQPRRVRLVPADQDVADREQRFGQKGGTLGAVWAKHGFGFAKAALIHATPDMLLYVPQITGGDLDKPLVRGRGGGHADEVQTKLAMEVGRMCSVDTSSHTSP